MMHQPSNHTREANHIRWGLVLVIFAMGAGVIYFAVSLVKKWDQEQPSAKTGRIAAATRAKRHLQARAGMPAAITETNQGQPPVAKKISRVGNQRVVDVPETTPPVLTERWGRD